MSLAPAKWSRGSPSLGEAQAQLARGLERRGDELVAVTVPAPLGRVAALLTALPRQPAAAYAPSGDESFVGLGSALELRADTPNRARAIRFTRDVSKRFPASRLFCGAGFSAASVGAKRWAGFPALLLRLPRWTYAQQGPLTPTSNRSSDLRLSPEGGEGRGEGGPSPASLTFVGAADSPRSRAVAHDELERLWVALAAAPRTQRSPQAQVRHLSTARWNALVADALGAIHTGAFQKLVVSRATRVTADAPLDVGSAFERLAALPGCTAFAVREGASTFLGATPETLVRKAGSSVSTEALAGTAPADRAFAALAKSDKDLREHRLVVDHIAAALRAHGDRVEVGARPNAKLTGAVVHLRTQIRGRALRATHLLDLAFALHPTPALAGSPSPRAVRWLAEHEPAARGWYGGFVGVVDAAGGGELSVAIRCGLIRGRRAWAYAGAGIVEGSVPEAEHAETALKLRPFLRALGATP